MEVMNCRNCKRLFNYITGPMICPACKDKLEKLSLIHISEPTRH